MSDYMTIAQAAEETGLPRRRLDRAHRSGRLKTELRVLASAFRYGPQIVVSREALRKWREAIPQREDIVEQVLAVAAAKVVAVEIREAARLLHKSERYLRTLISRREIGANFYPAPRGSGRKWIVEIPVGDLVELAKLGRAPRQKVAK